MKSVVIVGFGHMGNKYFHSLREMKNLETIAIVEKKNTFPKKKSKNKYLIYYDLKKCLEELKPNIVIISNNDSEHYSTLKIVLNSKYFPQTIICEKPLTLLNESSELIKKLAKKRKVKLIINYSRRFINEYKNIKKKIEKQKIIMVSIKYAKGFFHNGSHAIDFIRYFFGEILEYKILKYTNDYIKHDPSLSIFLKTKKADNIFISSLDERYFTLFEIEIITEKLRIIIDKDHSRIRFFEKKNNVGNPPGKRLIESKEISVNHDISITNILKNSQSKKDFTSEIFKSEEKVNEIFFSKFDLNIRLIFLINQYEKIYLFISDPGEYNLLELVLKSIEKERNKFVLICSGWAKKNVKIKFKSEDEVENMIIDDRKENSLLILGSKIDFSKTHKWLKISKKYKIDSAFFFNHWKHYFEHFPVIKKKRIYSDYIFFPDKLALASFKKKEKRSDFVTSIMPQLEIARILKKSRKLKPANIRNLRISLTKKNKIILFLFDPDPISKSMESGYNSNSIINYLKTFIDKKHTDCFFIFRPHPRQNNKNVKEMLKKILVNCKWKVDYTSDVSTLIALSDEVWGSTTILLIAALKLKKKILSFQINRNKLGIESSNPYIEPFVIDK